MSSQWPNEGEFFLIYFSDHWKIFWNQHKKDDNNSDRRIKDDKNSHRRINDDKNLRRHIKDDENSHWRITDEKKSHRRINKNKSSQRHRKGGNMLRKYIIAIYGCYVKIKNILTWQPWITIYYSRSSAVPDVSTHLAPRIWNLRGWGFAEIRL